ncbi:hypothetical protein SLEP1_g6848 [Rubroshorea leprosula]|uniref:Aminotransferase-like plant mobile domain-containing protein n=1 Tax=Rubroshorea leprosula TaxID=152421 RepID=A0AAV5I2D4_9ROSI|nr:hypothetical protein SLEP1_g6848 [Rubroshorea leprosula]
MSVSLFDVSSLTGLPCTGEEISALLTLPPGVEYNAELKPSYPAFVRSAYDKSKPVSADEYISFLLTLICKYIVCSAGKVPTKKFIPLAAALAYGKHMALGPFLLAHLYRSCQDIMAHPLVISGGPLWVLQLWLYSYFPALALVSFAVLTQDLLTYDFMFKNAVENKRSFEECLKFFASLSVDKPDADFVVFLGRSHGPSWYRADVKSPDFRAFWSVCVTSRDLFVGCSLNTLNSRCGMELYALYQFCRQLGYCQDIPFSPLFSFNHSYPFRPSISTELHFLLQRLVVRLLPSSVPRCYGQYFYQQARFAKESSQNSSQKENCYSCRFHGRNYSLQAMKNRRIKRSAVKPSAAKKLIRSTSPSRSTSTMETETQPDKAKDISLGLVTTKAPVEDIPAEGGESTSGSSHTKSGDGSSPATKSVAADVYMIDDDLENELLAQLDMLINPPAKSRSATDSKGKAVAEEVDFDINLPTQEQISFAIMTLQELLDGGPSHFCKFWANFTTIYTHFSKRFQVLESKVAAAESVRKSVADSTAAVFKKKEEFLAAKEAHVTQVKHLQELKEEISNLEAKLSELRNQVPLAEQTEKNLADQRNKLRVDMEAGLKSTAKIKEQLPSFTASTDEAVEEIKNMREEWSTWQNNLY